MNSLGTSAKDCLKSNAPSVSASDCASRSTELQQDEPHARGKQAAESPGSGHRTGKASSTGCCAVSVKAADQFTDSCGCYADWSPDRNLGTIAEV